MSEVTTFHDVFETTNATKQKLVEMLLYQKDFDDGVGWNASASDEPTPLYPDIV